MLDNLKSKKFWECTIARCIRTICQTMLSLIPAGIAINAVTWAKVLAVVGTSLLAGFLCILTCIVTGIPESEE